MNQSVTVLSVRGLCKTIRGREIVRDVTFDVKEGEIFGFLGPNGAGKTTTIRMLVGLIKPTRGSVTICGYDLVRHFIPAIRHVGCIVENPELYPFLSGRENLELFARMAEIPFERIEEVVRLVELEHRIDDLVKTYSLGMKQRLGIAQALLGKPRLLILDEPTNGLDPAGIRELRAFIHRLAREEGISVFISSHILSEVQLLCDRVAIIHQGRVVKTGSVEELIGGQTRVEWKMEPLEQGIALLKELPYVADVETVGEQVRAQMPPEQVADANERLIRSGVRVHAVHPLQPTLEEIFLQETGGSHNAPAGI